VVRETHLLLTADEAQHFPHHEVEAERIKNSWLIYWLLSGTIQSEA
jgi:hypothetical protein